MEGIPNIGIQFLDSVSAVVKPLLDMIPCYILTMAFNMGAASIMMPIDAVVFFTLFCIDPAVVV